MGHFANSILSSPNLPLPYPLSIPLSLKSAVISSLKPGSPCSAVLAAFNSNKLIPEVLPSLYISKLLFKLPLLHDSGLFPFSVYFWFLFPRTSLCYSLDLPWTSDYPLPSCCDPQSKPAFSLHYSPRPTPKGVEWKYLVRAAAAACRDAAQ